MSAEISGGKSAAGRQEDAVRAQVETNPATCAAAIPRSAAAPGALRRNSAGPTWWGYLGSVGVVKVLLLVALVAWLYWGRIQRMFLLWQQPDWSHGFLIPLFALYIVNARRRDLLTGVHPGSIWGLPVVILSLAAYTACIYLKIGYLPDLSLVSMIAGLVLLVVGWRALWLTLFPIGFLMLAIPPPERIYRAFTQPLQHGVAVVSTALLNLFPGADVSHEGFQVNFQMSSGLTGSFAIAGACSGMRSLMAFIALGLAMAYFTPRAIWQRIAMAVVVLPVAVFCNVLRVLITGALQMYGYAHLAKGTTHTMLGFLSFGIGFALYLLILYVLDHLYVEEAPDGPRDDTRPRRAETGGAP
jgi:exosortase